jgi:hypothetical protein
MAQLSEINSLLTGENDTAEQDGQDAIADYHNDRNRYRQNDRSDDLTKTGTTDSESRSEQPEMGLAEIQPASAVGLADHLRRELGANALAIEPANTDAGTDKPEQTDTKKSAWWREIRESAGRKLSDFSERARALPTTP